MPELGQNFNAQEQAPMGFTPLPEGDYKLLIDSSEIKEASTGAGNEYLQINFSVLEGEQQGREYVARLNLWNSKPAAVEMASKEFGEICMAAGMPNCNNSDHLHGKIIIGSLRVTPAKGNYGEGNAATGYSPVPGIQQNQQQQPQQNQAPQQNQQQAPQQNQASQQNQAPQQQQQQQQQAPQQDQGPQGEEPPPWG